MRTARPDGASLAEHHVEYLEARGVGDRERGMFWTAEDGKPSKIPRAFSERQRQRTPALIAEFPSPDGITVSWQKRDDRPTRDRSGKVQKWVSPPAERARIVLGVVPSMLDEVRNGTGPLWSVEGLTRAAALAPYGIPAVAWAGCWNWQKGGEPLPCWDHVNLDGRLVLVGPDGDWRTNENVQKALEAKIAFLESRGARVLVVDVPEIPGHEKPGIDDAIAAGVNPYTLAEKAQPFVRVDVARERLSRDEKLAQIVAACRRRVHDMPARKRAECSRRAVYRDLLRTGELKGKLRPEGLLVVRSSLDGAVGARMGERAWWNAIQGLEDAGELKRAKWGPNNDRPGAYLLTPRGGGSAERAHYRREAPERESQEREGEKKGAESFPPIYATSDSRVHETRAPGEVPALRWPKVVHTWAWREGRRVVVDSDYIARIGKQGEEVVRYLLENGAATTHELLEEFGSKTTRVRDFRRRRIAPLVDRGIIAADSEGVQLSPDWREALERAREETGEIDDNRLQAERVARRKQERREHFKRVRKGEDTRAGRTPALRGKEHTRESIERHCPEWERRRVEDERRRVGTTAAVFVADELAGGGVRWREMRERWAQRGGRGEDLRRAVLDGPYRFEREDLDGQLYVYATASRQVSERTATITPLYREGVNVHDTKKSDRKSTATVAVDHLDPGGDWRDHALDCECVRCSTPETRYATPRSAS